MIMGNEELTNESLIFNDLNRLILNVSLNLASIDDLISILERAEKIDNPTDKLKKVIYQLKLIIEERKKRVEVNDEIELLKRKIEQLSNEIELLKNQNKLKTPKP